MRRLALLLLTPACSFFFDPNGYTATDASTDGALDASPDATEDATEDAPDAGGDGGADAHFCETQTVPAHITYLCADFDEPDSGALGSQGSSCSGCSASIIADDDSPPNAWVFSFPAESSTTGGSLFCQVDAFDPGINGVNMAFDVKADTTDGVILALFAIGDSYFTMTMSSAWTVHEGQYTDAGVLASDYPLSTTVVDTTQWHRFSVTIDTQKSNMTATVDGAPAFSGTLKNPAFGGVAYQIGVDFLGGNLGPTRYHFDNVILWTTP